jgi:HEPN domain-containing protein
MSIETARKWLKQAQHDLRMAEKNIDIRGYDVAAFLAHQAVEKLLKSILIMEGKEAVKTHKLDRLAQLANLPSDITDKIIDLTEDYAISRYPDVSPTLPYLQYDLKISKSKVSVAKEVFRALKQRYKQLEE